MKIYGNSQTDGFPILLALVGAVFTMGGVGLANVGSVTFLVGLPVIAVLVAVMVTRLSKWDVMSVVPAIDVNTPIGAVVVNAAPVKSIDKSVTFAVAAVNEVSVEAAQGAWAASSKPSIKDAKKAAKSNKKGTGLPMPIEKPKSTVETNTHVA